MGTTYQDAFANKNVLITGGLGFIGSNIAHRLVELGAKVLLIDSLIPTYGGNLFNVHGIQDRLRINISDVRDPYGLDYLVRDQDIIFNLAGQVSHIDSMRDPQTDLEINCRSQLSILEACRKHNPTVKILYAGTRQQYGRPQYLPVDEKHPMHPTDINGVNKLAGEWYHIVYHQVYELRTCSLRLTNTYGPRMLVKHNRQTALGWFIRLALDDQEIQIWGDGQQLRDYTYIDDVVEAFLQAAASKVADGQIFNLGGRRPVSHLELIETLTTVAQSGRYRLVPWPPERKRIDIGDVYSSYRLIQQTLGWEPQVDLREGLERTVAFYRQNKQQYW
jgi:UDP-glucose 4-epimerase